LTPLVVDVKEAAASLGVSVWTLRRYVAERLIPVVEFPSTAHASERNRRLLFSVDDLRAFREQHRNARPEPDSALSAAAVQRWREG